jgi:hypothetical protein
MWCSRVCVAVLVPAHFACAWLEKTPQRASWSAQRAELKRGLTAHLIFGHLRIDRFFWLCAAVHVLCWFLEKSGTQID